MSNKLKSITLDGVTKEVDSGGGGGSMTKEEILATLGYEEIEMSMTGNNGNIYTEIILAKTKTVDEMPPYKFSLNAQIADGTVESKDPAVLHVDEITFTAGGLTFTQQDITVNASYGYFALPIVVESQELIDLLPSLQQVGVSITNLTCEGVSFSGTGTFNKGFDTYFRWDGSGDFAPYLVCWEDDECAEVGIDMAYPMFINASTAWGSGALSVDDLTIVAEAPNSVQGQNICYATNLMFEYRSCRFALTESERQTVLNATSASLVAHNLRNDGVIVSGGETVIGAITAVTTDEYGNLIATFTLDPSSFGTFEMLFDM